MFKPLLLLCLFLSCAVSVVAQAQQANPPSAAARKAWGFDASDMAPHPGVRFGVLPNGMRYAIMRNDAPANGISVRLRFEAGAMDEEEGEQGYLHLLEHLIFHGSENIPPGTLPLMFAQRGMKRLTDFNAVTSYDETVYRLDLSKSDHNARAAALMLMRDISSRLSFTRRSIEAAKRDVITEMGTRDQVRDRIAGAQKSFFFPGTPLARSSVIGTKSSVGRATPEKLRQLYDRHYIPRRAILVVVGDFDPSVMEAEIASAFSDWRGAAGEVRSDRSSADPPVRQRGSARLFVDRAAPTSITIASLFPLGGADESRIRDAQFLERLGNDMLNRRLARIAAEPDAPFSSASGAIYNHFSTARIASLDVAAKDPNWRAALVAAAVELRRVLDNGFSQLELDEQLALTREALVRAAAPPNSAALADAIIDAAGRGLLFTQPADPAATADYLGRVGLDEVNAAFRAAWPRAGQMLFVTHHRRFDGAEAAIMAAWSEGFRESRSATK